MSTDINWPCERCGKLRRLLLERRPGLIAIAVGILMVGVGPKFLLSGPAGPAALWIAAILACVTAGTLVRIRCVRCEPAWRMKAWKLAGRDLDG
jgi:hypothetical protein